MSDNMKCFTNKILEHRRDLKKKVEIEFLVSWLGYAQEHNSCEPYKALRNSEQLHTYLAETIFDSSKISRFSIL